MSKVIVLGAGMVGSAMAIDMADKHEVVLADLNELALLKAKDKCADLDTIRLDVTNKEKLVVAIQSVDLVICAVPGFLGFDCLRNIIETGVDVVDISFFPENALDLDALAKDRGVTAVVDCGVAPGLGNILLGYHNERMKIHSFECLVGGLPKERKWPFYYKAPFSPVDVIEEYTRPARYVENGKLVIRPPLSDCEYVEFDGVGTLESFNTDGLRSLIDTMPHIPNKKEKTLRYPGHVEYIKVLKESGFFNEKPVDVDGVMMSPLRFTSRILFDEWKLNEGEEEITVMRVQMKGWNKDGIDSSITYHLYDEYDPGTNTSSMSRTTGYTATAVANLVLDGKYARKGISPPEFVGKPDLCFDFILQYLQERNINLTSTLKIKH